MESLPQKLNDRIILKLSAMIRRPWIKYSLFLGALFTALFLYTFHITSDLYGDEVGQTYHVITMGNFWSNIMSPSMCHPPLFFMVVKFFYELAGKPWSMRIPSLLFSLGTIILLSYMAKRILRPEFFLPAAWLAVLSPFLLEFAAEARTYAMLIFFSVGLIWAFVEFLKSEDIKNMLILTMVSILGAAVHYFFWYLLLFIGIYYLIIRRRISRYAWGVVTINFIILMPIVIYIFFVQKAKFTEYLQVLWSEAYFSIPNFIARLAVALSYGYSTFYLPRLDPARNFTFNALKENWLLIPLVFISFIGFAYSWFQLALQKKKWVGFLTLGLLIPIVLSLIAGKAGFYLIREKHLAVIWICYFLLLLLALNYLVRYKIGWFVVVCHFTVIVISIVHYVAYPNEFSRRMDWTGLNQTLERKVTNSDLILFYSESIKGLSLGKLKVLDGDVKQINLQGDRPKDVALNEIAESIDLKTGGAIFLINDETHRHEVDPYSEIIRTLGKRRIISEHRFGRNLILYVFKLPSTFITQ